MGDAAALDLLSGDFLLAPSAPAPAPAPCFVAPPVTQPSVPDSEALKVIGELNTYNNNIQYLTRFTKVFPKSDLI